MTDHLATSPPFTVAGVTFRCWVTDGGHRYEWRSTDGRCRVGRNVGNAMCWAIADGRVLGTHFASLKLAMIAAVRAADRRAA